MSKKQFIALADQVRRYNQAALADAPVFNNNAICALAQFCEGQNPRFMRGRWLDYIAGKCGPNGGAIKS